MTLREAVAKSLNLPAVRVIEKLGVPVSKLYASSVGIPFEERDVGLTLALGGFTTGVSPLTLGNAFTPFANGGYFSLPGCITKIEDSSGNIIYEKPATKSAVLSKETAFLMTSMLETAAQTGTARRVAVQGVPIAAKTGTSGSTDTEGNKDAWTVAYNAEYTMCCWMGFDSTDELHSLPADVTGGTYPAEMINKVFRYIYRNRKAPSFQKPSTIVEARIDIESLKSGGEPKLASAFTPDGETMLEYFTKDKAPTETTEYWAVPEPPNDLRVLHGSGGYPRITFSPVSDYVVYQLIRTDTADNSQELIGEFKGREPVDIVDFSAQYGRFYEYHIVPVHPEIIINGEPLLGQPSEKITIEVLAEEAYMP